MQFRKEPFCRNTAGIKMYELQNYTDSELHYVYSSFIQKKNDAVLQYLHVHFLLYSVEFCHSVLKLDINLYIHFF